MAFQYEIDSDNVITLWEGDKETSGHLVQPTWPNGTAWASKKEAEDWAKAHIASLEDETADRAGNSPEQKTIPVSELQLSEEEIAAIEAAREADLAARAAAEIVEETPAPEAE